MQIVRYIFSYSIIVVVVVMIASGYYYRETLFPNLFPLAGHHQTPTKTTSAMGGMGNMGGMTEKQTATAQPMQDQAKIAQAKPGMSPAVTEPAPESPVTLPSPVPQSTQIETTSQITTDRAHPAETANVTRQQPDANSPVPTEPRHMALEPAAQPAMPMNRQAAPTAAIQQPGTQRPTVEHGSVSSSQQMQAEDIGRVDSETIMRARGAYWEGDFAASEQAYQQLIDRYPNEVELQGEVGNVYYAQGKWAQAALAYAQVVRQLYRTRQNAQADYMLQIVSSLDRELGEQLLRERDGTPVQQ